MGKNGVHFKGAENFLKIHKILQKWKRNLGKLCPKSFLSNYPKIFWSVWGYFFFLIFKHLGKVRLPWRSFRHLSHPSQKHNISWFPKNLLFTFTVILSNPSESGEEAMLWERKDIKRFYRGRELCQTTWRWGSSFVVTTRMKWNSLARDHFLPSLPRTFFSRIKIIYNKIYLKRLLIEIAKFNEDQTWLEQNKK